MNKKNLYEHLLDYTKSGYYPMHMPGHKRNPEFFMENPYLVDVTEVEGTDNLHHPESVIKELSLQMQRVYRTKQSYPLINGSTCGILAAISACCHRGDKILMARNCHRSVYHALYLLELRPVYLYPEQDFENGIALEISPSQVESMLQKHPEVSCVLLTSPTYEGVLSDVASIASVVHKRNLPLLVDGAHGAHLIWSDYSCLGNHKSAVSQGADLVIQSLHKTLPCFTQTAVLHRCSERIPKELLERYLAIYETSSPSYILMAGMAQCMDWLEKKGKQAFEIFEQQRKIFGDKAKGWSNLTLWEHPKQEPSKLVILTNKSGKTGQQLADTLRSDYQIEVEMATVGYVLAMTSVADTKEGWKRFMEALTEIDQKWSKEWNGSLWENKYKEKSEANIPLTEMNLYEAMNCPYEEVALSESEGEISAEYAFIYPPGIPFLVPGERIQRETIESIQEAKEKKLELLGLADENALTIRVCRKKGN